MFHLSAARDVGKARLAYGLLEYWSHAQLTILYRQTIVCEVAKLSYQFNSLPNLVNASELIIEYRK